MYFILNALSPYIHTYIPCLYGSIYLSFLLIIILHAHINLIHTYVHQLSMHKNDPLYNFNSSDYNEESYICLIQTTLNKCIKLF